MIFIYKNILKAKIIVIIAFTIVFSCFSYAGNMLSHSGPRLSSVKYEELRDNINSNDNILYVVNFWATWCKPCIEELPYFLEINEKYKKESNFKMILVSLDSPKLLNTRVKQFVQKNQINTDVLLLDDAKRMNFWINDIDSNWSGAIPATIFIKNGEKLVFHEGQLSKEELEKIILQNINGK